MFKKIILIALIVGNSYAVEPTKDMEGNSIVNNITQSNITQQMSNITLSTVNNIQSNTNNIDNINTINSTNNVQSSNTQPSDSQLPSTQLLSTQVSNIQTNSSNSTSENLFDIKKLITTKHFIKMNEDEKDWTRLDAYERLSKESQKFWQTVIAEKKITDTTKGELYCSSGYRLCVLVGIDPLNVIFDELEYNIDESCLVDSNLYLSAQQLSALKAQINQCTSITKRNWQGILFVMKRLNTDNTDYAASIYFRWKYLNPHGTLYSSHKKNPKKP